MSGSFIATGGRKPIVTSWPRSCVFGIIFYYGGNTRGERSTQIKAVTFHLPRLSLVFLVL